jgi:hypothetical protein
LSALRRCARRHKERLRNQRDDPSVRAWGFHPRQSVHNLPQAGLWPLRDYCVPAAVRGGPGGPRLERS